MGAGRSQAQLQDYVACLEEEIARRGGSLRELQEEVKSLEAFRRDDTSPLSSPTTPSSFALTAGRSRYQPLLEQTTRQQQVASKAKHLVQAAASGDTARLRSFLNQRADVNALAWGGATPLMTAARHGRDAALHLLLTARADVGRTDTYGRTALDHAQYAPVASRSSVVNCLRGHGGMSGKELKARVDALARHVFDIESKFSKLNEQKSKLPTQQEIAEYEEILRRTSSRPLLERRRSLGPVDLTPKGSPSLGPSSLIREMLPEDDVTPSFSVAGFLAEAQAAGGRPPMLPIPSAQSPFGAGLGSSNGRAAMRW